jgi:hypothetical protein
VYLIGIVAFLFIVTLTNWIKYKKYCWIATGEYVVMAHLK